MLADAVSGKLKMFKLALPAIEPITISDEIPLAVNRVVQRKAEKWWVRLDHRSVLRLRIL
jgi:hypothetical protein